jgi:hypothetical protein
MTCEGLKPLLVRSGKNVVCKSAYRKTCADIKNMTVVMNQLEALKDDSDNKTEFVRCIADGDGVEATK